MSVTSETARNPYEAAYHMCLNEFTDKPIGHARLRPCRSVV